MFPLVRELAAQKIPVAVTCRVLAVSTSGYYEWKDRPLSQRAVADQKLTTLITEIYMASRRSYGSPRIHAELREKHGICVGRKRVSRLMKQVSISGIKKRRRGCTTRDLEADPHPDLVNRTFTVDQPNVLWCMDITQHGSREGWVYCAVVLDAYSRRIVGWSIADHLRTELVLDALDMACSRRNPSPGTTIAHSDHGCQYTSWAFGQHLRKAGLLGSMGSIGDCYDNSLVESFFGTMQRELLDQQTWRTRHQLANAIFEWIEGWYNPHRRHSSIGMLSPVEFETRTLTAQPQAV